MTTKANIRILLTGGGTGGHVFPAIAIADAIKALRPDAVFLFVGALGKIEMERVPQAGYDIVGLNVAGFQRGFSLNALGRNLSFPFKLLGSILRAKQILKRFQPDLVIGTGGYASGPVMRAAQQLGIATVIQEQNSYPGVTNKMLAAKAACICVAYDGMSKFFPEHKIVLSGNPVRQDLLNLNEKRIEALKHFNLDPNKKTVYLTGGSLGAGALNNALVDGYEALSARTDVQILWQCGKFYFEKMRSTPTAQMPNVHILPFVDRVDMAYAAADVVVARAGALTISELCVVGKPAILVPSPNVAEDHQTKNALALSSIGAARLVRDAELKEKLLPELFAILGNEALAFALGEHMHALGKPNAARVIADTVLRLIDSPQTVQP